MAQSIIKIKDLGIVVTELNCGNITVEANSNYTFTPTMEKPGYMPLGIAGFSLGNTGSSIFTYALRPSTREEGYFLASIGVRNTSSSKITTAFYLEVIWMKL